jgi:putative restriction endonuclease
VDPNDRRVLVSKRIREEFENGCDYYRLHGKHLVVPVDPASVPSRTYLQYHFDRFR